MKSYYYFLCLFLFTVACSRSQKGELPNYSPTIFKEAKPHGMVAVERGAFRMGTPNDSVWGSVNDSMTVSIENFWMDECEVSNFMYKHFVNWVKDSITREKLSEVDPGFKNINKFSGDTSLNWKKPIPYRSKDPNVQAVFKQMYWNDKNQNRQIVNSLILNFAYEWIDQEKATQRKYSLGKRVLNTDMPYDQNADVFMSMDSSYVNAKGHIITVQIRRPLRHYEDYYTRSVVNVYPDTNCWKADFNGEKNDMYVAMYFASTAYLNYPVVGVSWEQANAFCFWRTKYHRMSSKCEIAPYRLPTEAEWEYAAKGGKKGHLDKKYPWKSEDMTSPNGRYFANFKPRKGDFVKDKYLITAPIGSFAPNELGLYDIVGNVSEWTTTAYFSSGNKIMSTMNSTTELNALVNSPYQLKRKVVRGGSYKDVYNFVNVNLREWKYQNEQLPFVGFRCVRNIPGEY